MVNCTVTFNLDQFFNPAPGRQYKQSHGHNRGSRAGVEASAGAWKVLQETRLPKETLAKKIASLPHGFLFWGDVDLNFSGNEDT